ncbi:MAG TPA: hypothetical protein VLW06_08805 [Terriglobales bacterium]|nr:hypothetical protein [Terriglobales bacterium]
MLRLYKFLLHFYPASYRREFAGEMTTVFREARKSAEDDSVAMRVSFYVREIRGLLAGALREHLRAITGGYQWIPFRRFDMRPEFRFPKSTVVLMAVIFLGVELAIQEAKHVVAKYSTTPTPATTGFPWFIVWSLLATVAVAVIGWSILFALRRTGVHRLANLPSNRNSLN